ncbi:MAG: DUF4097 family beta strand repeat-containing protein [Oscillospiraceae bacterium]
MKKNVKTALIVALSLFGTGILISLCVLFSVNFDLSKLSVNHSTAPNGEASAVPNIKAEYVEKSIEASGQEITLNLISSNVTVKPSEDGDIHISYYNTNETYFELLDKGGEITLTQRSKTNFILNFDFFNYEKYNVDISIPAEHGGDLEINSTSGDIFISEIRLLGEFDIGSVSGNITVRNSTAENISAESTSGNVKLADVETAGIDVDTVSGEISLSRIPKFIPISLETTSGEVYAEDIEAENIKVESVSGDIIITNVSGQKANLSTSSGDVDLNGADFAALIFNTISGDISGTVSGSSDDYTVYTSTLSGSSSLSSHRGRGEKTLDLSSTSGSFDIRFKN